MKKFSAIVRLAGKVVGLVISLEKAISLAIDLISKVANCRTGRLYAVELRI
jgi:hypothetical protein